MMRKLKYLLKKFNEYYKPYDDIDVYKRQSFDRVTLLAKKAMLREIGTHHPDQRYQALEEELLEKINQTGIGPAGYGGKTTALSLNIETYPTHIAGMPVAVSICCHVARHKEVIL